MSMMAFHEIFPEVARAESRAIKPPSHSEIPSRPFVLLEAYCSDPACDCRRVLIAVLDTETNEQVATINYAFEPPEPPFDDEGQVFLDPLNPQSEHSEAFLGIFSGMVEDDLAYRERLIRHYSMWKEALADPAHPAHVKIRSAQPSFGFGAPAGPAGRAARRVRPNDPCPCGSGRKWKKCCRGKAAPS